MLNKNINSQVLFMAVPPPPPPPPPTSTTLPQTTDTKALFADIKSGVNGFKLKKVDPSLIKDRSTLQTGASGVSTTTNANAKQAVQPNTSQQQQPKQIEQLHPIASSSLFQKIKQKNNPDSKPCATDITKKPPVPPKPSTLKKPNAETTAETKSVDTKATAGSPKNPTGSTNSISKINFEKQSGFLMALVKLIVNFCRIFYSNAFHAKQTDPKAETMSKMFKDVNTLIFQNNSNELSTKLGQMKNCIEAYNANGKPCFNQFRAEQFNELIDKASAKNLITIA